MKSRFEYLIKHNLIIQKIYKIVLSSVLKFLSLFIKMDPKLILFNGHGWGFNDSPRAIYEYMQNSEYKDYKFVWALKQPSLNITGECEKVKIDSLKYFLTALRAKYWISCVNIERGLKFKKKGNVYVNTWHGTPLKFIGNSVSKRRDFDFSDIDYFCSAGNYETEIYLRDFNVKKKSIINTGLPRNDILYQHSKKQVIEIKNRLNIDSFKKVILYAPTWRDSKNKGQSYEIKPPIDFNKWQKELGLDYVVLLRTHTYTNSLLGVAFNDFIRDFSKYDNVNDLIIIADLLISDYSAILFDYSITEKHMLCFGYDYQEYEKERGLYIDLGREIPNGVIKSENDLIEKIKNIDYNILSNETKNFKNKYLEYGGRATELVVQTVFKRK